MNRFVPFSLAAVVQEGFIKGANLRLIKADGLKVLGVEGPFDFKVGAI